MTTLPQPVALPSISSAGDVYETETSPVNTRIAGASAAAVVDDDEVAGAVSEGEVRASARKSFGQVAGPYLSPYVHKRGVLDAEYCWRKIGNRILSVIPMRPWIQTVTSILGISILKAHEVFGATKSKK